MHRSNLLISQLTLHRSLLQQKQHTLHTLNFYRRHLLLPVHPTLILVCPQRLQTPLIPHRLMTTCQMSTSALCRQRSRALGRSRQRRVSGSAECRLRRCWRWCQRRTRRHCWQRHRRTNTRRRSGCRKSTTAAKKARMPGTAVWLSDAHCTHSRHTEHREREQTVLLILLLIVRHTQTVSTRHVHLQQLM